MSVMTKDTARGAAVLVSVKIPVAFDQRFLAWFRNRTEATWAALPPASYTDILANFIATDAGGCVWQPGTRWLGGLSNEAIEQIERAQRLVFPSDYRLFLNYLHTTNKPQLCAGYLESGALLDEQSPSLAHAYLDEYQQYIVLEEFQSMPNWLIAPPDPQAQVDELCGGIAFDIENNNLWPVAWGERPSTQRARKQRLKELVAGAPRLIHIYGSRYLLADPPATGNPIFSIDQADVVVYAANLREYLLFEFAELLGLARPKIERMTRATVRAHAATYASIPFWNTLGL
jgi:hypothetical protein